MRTAAILAGGQARRFGGRAKALLPLGTLRLIDRQLNVLRPVVDEIGIVTTDRAQYDALGVPVWQDLSPGRGPLGGIQTALAHTAAAWTLVVAGDLPFLTTPFLEHLVQSGENAETDIVIPRTDDGHQPLCAAYGRACESVIRRRIDAGLLKVTDILVELRVRELGPEEVARFDPSGTLFMNVNTPDDYTRAQALVADSSR